MSTEDNNNDNDGISNDICANCGKEGCSSDMNTCNKCKSVKYCNAACKKKHRSKHKKACERRVAELHDEALFKEPPNEKEECQICFLTMPSAGQKEFKSCCGKLICSGCIYTMKEKGGKGKLDLCAFCRTPEESSDKEHMKRLKELMDKGNDWAFFQFGSYFVEGVRGMPKDINKALELWQRAGELGCAEAYFSIGAVNSSGRGVAVDKEKAKHYYELAAMMGDETARNNLGFFEQKAGNMERAMKHYIISACGGYEEALFCVQRGYKNGIVTKT